MTSQTLGRDLRLPSFKIDPRGVAFFLLVPLALAAITATTTGYSRTLGLGGAFLYVALLSVIPWWIGEGTTRAAWYCLRRFRPPLWLVCKVGILIACIFVGPYASFVSSVFASHWPGSGLATESQGAFADAVIQILRATFFWVAANYAFDRLLDYPRFRYVDEVTPQSKTTPYPETTSSGLLGRLTKIGSLSEIRVVKAEEHYVRVTSDKGEELASYKFGAAVKDLEEQDGFQVHRSYWVRRSAVVGTKTVGSRLQLELWDGSSIPVSGPYQALVRQVF